MTVEQTGWKQKLDALRVLTASDFSAAAHFDAAARRIRWFAASGNQNERYRHMNKRPGQGVAGEVVRFGEIVLRTYASPDQLGPEDYIMYAEQLLVAAAAPAGNEDSGERGVLLIGRRTSKPYTSHEIQLLEEQAKVLFEAMPI